jgi:hypothetical protein
MYADLRAAGLDPASPPKRHPWGKTDFRLIDPDGYSLEFGGLDGPGGAGATAGAQLAGAW